MPLIRPFAGLCPAPGRAADVAAPPYDVVSEEEARAQIRGRPWSFLHVSRPEVDLPPGTDPHSDLVYRTGARNLAAMEEQGILHRDPSPCYYLYRLDTGEHQQTGLVAAASVSAYDENRIRRHELTRPDKETDRVRQIDALNAQTGPVFLAHRSTPAVAGIVAEVTGSRPEVSIRTPDGVRHSLWRVSSSTHVEALSEAFEAMPVLYIADGHHRSAAASRVAADRRAGNPAHTGDEHYNYFLAVIFPHDQVRILDYNRAVADLNGLRPADFLARVAERYDVTPSDTAVRPAGRGQMSMYLDGQWYRLQIHADRLQMDDPVSRLDVSLLTMHLLAPVLDITDLRRDNRIDFVGGIRGLEALEERVDSGRMAVAFALPPTSVEDLLSVADAGLLMPPKSTWFEPKLADGLVSHALD